MKRRQALKISSIGAIGITASIGTSAAKNNYSFDHGVASGDPLEDRVILWTRLSPNKSGPHEVLLEVSNKINFSKVAFTKKLQTSSLSDYTVKYDFMASKHFDDRSSFLF